MDIVVGVSCPVTSLNSVVKRLRILKSLDIRWVELGFTRGIPSSILNDLKIIINRIGIENSIHAPYFINLCSEKLDVRERSLEIIKKCLDIANMFNSHYVVIHAAYYMSYGPTLCYRLVLQNLKIVADYIEKNGYTCKIAIETMGRDSQFGTLDEVLRLCKDIGIRYVVPCIDWAHIYIRNRGIINYEDILMKISENLKDLKNLHTHFTCVQDLEDEHMPLEIDKPSFKNLIICLKKFKNTFNRVNIICESPMLEKDALKMLKIIKNLE